MLNCISCRTRTPDKGQPIRFVSKNNRQMMKAKCGTCGRTKCEIVKSSGQAGEGVISDTAAKLAKKVFGGPDTVVYKGEKHVPGYSWAGPGTNVKARLQLLKFGLSEPVSEADHAAFDHDLDYVKIRYRWEQGMPKPEVLKLTQRADDAFIRRVKASKDDPKPVKVAIEAAFKAKRIHESIFKTPLFVKGGSHDPTDKAIVTAKLSFE